MNIRRMTPHDDAHVRELSVTDAQLPFVGTIQSILDGLTEYQDCHVVDVDGVLVGFFIIDRAYSQQYMFCDPADIGFRAFFVDKRFQGHGYGKQCVLALRDYLRTEYPNYPGVVLTVNCKNQKAHRIYLDGGFVDNGDLYYGGSAGPQHILRLALD